MGSSNRHKPRLTTNRTNYERHTMNTEQYEPDNRPEDGRICDCEDAPCSAFFEDWAVCDDMGEPKGQCLHCGYKWYDHALAALPELKPCPFCGSPAEIRDDGDGWTMDGPQPFWVQCIHCPAMMKDFHTADWAAYEWNLRHNTPDQERKSPASDGFKFNNHFF